MGWETGGGLRRDGTYVYPWLIQVDVWKKPTEYCKEIFLQKTNYIPNMKQSEMLVLCPL